MNLGSDNTPLRVLIYGSCVSRDPFAAARDGRLELVGYIARSSLVSSMLSAPFPYKESDLEPISSPFQRKMVRGDLKSRELKQRLRLANYDILLIDLVDERICVEQPFPGTWITRSPEFLQSSIRLPKGSMPLLPWSEEKYRYWCWAWKEFVKMVTKYGEISRIRINKVYWSTLLPDGTHCNFDDTDIEHVNAELARMYDRMAQDIPMEQFYIFTSEELTLDVHHQWGASPYHYASRYWNALLAKLCDERSVDSRTDSGR